MDLEATPLSTSDLRSFTFWRQSDLLSPLLTLQAQPQLAAPASPGGETGTKGGEDPSPPPQACNQLSFCLVMLFNASKSK